MVFGRVASPGCIVASCRRVFCVVSCGVGWCRLVPGVGFVMSRRVLFSGDGLCGVVLCFVAWCCVVFVWVWCFVLCDVVVYRWFLSRAALRRVVEPLCCVVRCGVLRCVGLCRGGGMWLRWVAVCGGVHVVRPGVSRFVLVLGGFHGLRQLSCCRVVLCFLVCLCCVACFLVLLCVAVSGFVCCVGLVWCWVLSRCVMWCGGVSCGLPLWCVALWFVVLCCFVVVHYDWFWRAFVLRRCFVWLFWLLRGLLLACFVGMLVARHCCVVWRRVMCCCVLSSRRMAFVLCRGVTHVVLSCRALVRWVVRWCVASAISTRCYLAACRFV